MNIMLVRHGKTEWNVNDRIQGWSDIDLNEEGIFQVKKFCKMLKKGYWNYVLSSDLKRASHTANLISEYLNIPIITYSGFRERNYGKLEGATKQELANEYLKINYLSTMPEGESYKTFYRRVHKCLYDVICTYGNAKIIIVAHNGVLQIISNYFGVSNEWDNLSYAHFTCEEGEHKGVDMEKEHCENDIWCHRSQNSLQFRTGINPFAFI